MLLLTIHETLSPASGEQLRERYSGYASRMPLQEAMNRLARFWNAYNKRHGAICRYDLRLIGVGQIEEVDESALNALAVVMIESLPQEPDEF